MSRAHVKAWPAIALLLFGDAALAQQAPPEPKLIVAISVDQLSADLFAQYRNHFSGGFARLLSGAVFPSAYQSHAATETCPGHSTILTGMRPANTGIIANKWVDQSAGRPDKMIYCAEARDLRGSVAIRPMSTRPTCRPRAPWLERRRPALIWRTIILGVS